MWNYLKNKLSKTLNDDLDMNHLNDIQPNLWGQVQFLKFTFLPCTDIKSWQLIFLSKRMADEGKWVFAVTLSTVSCFSQSHSLVLLEQVCIKSILEQQSSPLIANLLGFLKKTTAWYTDHFCEQNKGVNKQIGMASSIMFSWDLALVKLINYLLLKNSDCGFNTWHLQGTAFLSLHLLYVYMIHVCPPPCFIVLETVYNEGKDYFCLTNMKKQLEDCLCSE